jgi:putative phosphoesterase
MEILVCSDLHASVSASEKVVELYKNENADFVVLCGDIYNGFSSSYAETMARNLETLSGRIVCAKGNNDYSGDCEFSPFDYVTVGALNAFGRKLYYTHGHIYNENRLPPQIKAGDILCYGHTHFGKLSKVDGIYICNVGSLTFPRACSPRSYAVIDESGIELKTLMGKTISKLDFDKPSIE